MQFISISVHFQKPCSKCINLRKLILVTDPVIRWGRNMNDIQLQFLTNFNFWLWMG